jgi:stalled ribosome rescue protein Dom34
MNNQKQFGVWMDTHKATVVGNDEEAAGGWMLLAHVKAEDTASNSSEKTSNNHEKTIQSKFFKEIASYMVNATQVHVTGTGQVQEQFINYLSETPQFKNTKATESTSNQMSEQQLLELMETKF